jgi:hypothetical protein
VSAVPSIVDQLVTSLTSVMDNVCDGVPQSWPDQDALIVGGARDGRGITIETNPAGFTGPDSEIVNVACVIVVVGDDFDVKPLRDRAFAYYNAVATKIRQNKTLGGAVASARLAAAELSQFLVGEGGSVELAFIISCTAYV